MQQQMDPALAAGKPTDKVRSEAIRHLRKMALEAKDGDFLGAEPDLLRRLEVSRPTLRQALRLLEHEQLIQVKMGPLGGCYAARPGVESVVKAAATYLQVKQAPLHEMMGVYSMLTVHLVDLAAACEDAGQRDALAAFVEKINQQPLPSSAQLFHGLEAEFMGLIRAMASNRSLDLFLQVSKRFIDLVPQARMLIMDSSVMRVRRRMWLQLAHAILNHDRQLAQQLAEQQLDLIYALIPPEALDKSVVETEPLLPTS